MAPEANLGSGGRTTVVRTPLAAILARFGASWAAKPVCGGTLHSPFPNSPTSRLLRLSAGKDWSP
jgi:hypothetical protein